MSHIGVTTAGLDGCGASALQQQFRRLTKAVPQRAYKLYEALSSQWVHPGIRRHVGYQHQTNQRVAQPRRPNSRPPPKNRST